MYTIQCQNSSSAVGKQHRRSKEQATTHTSEEAFSAHLLLYLTLLRRLKIIEDEKSFDLKADRKTMGLHAEVYDALILLAPFFQRRNPMLEQNLRCRKEAMCMRSLRLLKVRDIY